MDDFRFEILYADAEDVALDVFDDGGVEFVILDYHLQQGNGLNCLKELRRRDQSCRSSPSRGSPRRRSPRISCKPAPTITSASVTSQAACWPIAYATPCVGRMSGDGGRPDIDTSGMLANRAVFNLLDDEPGAMRRHSKNPPASPLRNGGKYESRRLSPLAKGGSGGCKPRRMQGIGKLLQVHGN